MKGTSRTVSDCERDGSGNGDERQREQDGELRAESRPPAARASQLAFTATIIRIKTSRAMMIVVVEIVTVERAACERLIGLSRLRRDGSELGRVKRRHGALRAADVDAVITGNWS